MLNIKNIIIIIIATVLASAQLVVAANIGNSSGYAWLEKLGWVAIGGGSGPDYGVTTGSAALSGYAWSEKTGWINFDDSGSYYSVTNDGAGNLSGYAFSEKLGYISFEDWQSGQNYYQVSLGLCSSVATPGAVIFQGNTIIKDSVVAQPGKKNMCFSGYGWSEIGGYINFNDAGGLYQSETTWTP